MKNQTRINRETWPNQRNNLQNNPKETNELPDKEFRIILLSSVYYQRTRKQIYEQDINKEIETIEEKQRF